AAHVWTGIGRLVYVLSSPMIADLVEPGISIDLRAIDIVAASNTDVAVEGPCHELAPEAAALFPPR
ncbi:MAG: nucleoside deaminase, partial [Ilumatobacteraceae bacterium]